MNFFRSHKFKAQLRGEFNVQKKYYPFIPGTYH